MKIQVVCTSKPCDGLFYYSYEYCSLLNSLGIDTKLVVITHRQFSKIDYIHAILEKYIHCDNIAFNQTPFDEAVSLVMGRSMITLSYKDFNFYTTGQQSVLRELFGNKIISVYSENHPLEYPKALGFYQPRQVENLCDKEVYPNGVGDHFEKRINFGIYKPYVEEIQFKYLFLGTNDKYYAGAEKVLDSYKNHGIITYPEQKVNKNNNNLVVPVENLLGKFETYVYTKETFDPAPRLLQECKYFDKDIIYSRDKNLIDGGSVYWSRKIEKPNAQPIIDVAERLHAY